jgi:hypothetical protein
VGALALVVASLAGASGSDLTSRIALERSSASDASRIRPLRLPLPVDDPGGRGGASESGDQVIAPPPDVFDGPALPPAPPPALLSAPPSVGGAVYAAMIGINDYPGTNADLSSAVSDAEEMNLALHNFGAPVTNRLVVRDTEANVSTIKRAIQWLVDRAGPDSTAVFFFAGHVRKIDSDTEAIVGADGRLFTDSELAAALAPLRARRVWVVMASCFAGGFTEVLGPGRILTAASDANSLAYENVRFHRSYLVQYLVHQAWVERRSGPSVQEAFTYAQEALRQEYPDRVPLQFDDYGAPMRLDDGTYQSAPPTTTPPPPRPPPSSGGGGKPPSPPPTSCEPTLIILCKS